MKRPALIQLFANAHSEGLNYTWKPLGGDIAQSGELGYMYGIYSIKQDTITEKGTYVSVWKKDKDGRWKYVLDSGNEGIGE
jgi:ketosteroid isomerase-like protein